MQGHIKLYITSLQETNNNKQSFIYKVLSHSKEKTKQQLTQLLIQLAPSVTIIHS